MNKRLYSIALIVIMLLVSLPICGFAEVKTAESVYGTPVIDAEVDEVWNNANYYVVENCNKTGEKRYKGWFKTMWDEENIYFLAKVYTTQYDASGFYHFQDSIDFYIDENRGRTMGFEDNGDYQVRVNFNGLVTGNNYYDFNKVNACAKRVENAFIVEMAFPLYGDAPTEGKTVGFEVLMTASATSGIEMREYLWNTEKGWLWNDTRCYGNLTFKKSVNVIQFNEPEWIPPTSTAKYVAPNDIFDTPNMLINDVITTFEDSETKNYTFPILHVREYPCMEINNLATVIGGTVKDGKTIIKDDIEVTFYDGSPLAGYIYQNNEPGRLMLEREPVTYEGKLYVPVSFVQPTLEYYMHYNRFGKKLVIRTCKDYPKAANEDIFYAKDFGAVGDGVHEDGEAITHAINAAINTGRPSKVVLESGKTYLLGSRADNYGYFYIDDVENFTLDGKGSTLVFETPTNNIAEIVKSNNIKFTNLEIEYKEYTSSQGRIFEVDKQNGTMKVRIDEGFPLPASNEWVKHFYSTGSKGGWWFTQIVDPIKPRPKFKPQNNVGMSNYDIFIDQVNKIAGTERDYVIKVQTGNEQRLNEVDINDRIVLNTRMSAYDVGDWTHNGLIHGSIRIYYSGDVTFENVNVYGMLWNGINSGRNWGNLRLINFGERTKDGKILAVNSDGIHFWDNRGALVMNGCHMGYALDDQINTYAQSKTLYKIIDDYTYEIGRDVFMWEEGDELSFVDADTHKVLGHAFIKNAVNVNGLEGYRITVDRKIEGVEEGVVGNARNNTIVYNIDASGRGSVVRNTRFEYGRRYAWLNKSPNSLFENNTVYECGGSGIANTEEYLSGVWQGPIPSCFTMRNNNFDLPDQIRGEIPVQIHYITGGTVVPGEAADMKGILMENNTFNTGRNSIGMRITSVDGLYMYNNKITSEMVLDKGGIISPVLIENTKIGEIDGFIFDFKRTDNVNRIFELVACENADAIKNIQDQSPKPIANPIKK